MIQYEQELKMLGNQEKMGNRGVDRLGRDVGPFAEPVLPDRGGVILQNTAFSIEQSFSSCTTLVPLLGFVEVEVFVRVSLRKHPDTLPPSTSSTDPDGRIQAKVQVFRQSFRASL